MRLTAVSYLIANGRAIPSLKAFIKSSRARAMIWIHRYYRKYERTWIRTYHLYIGAVGIFNASSRELLEFFFSSQRGRYCGLPKLPGALFQGEREGMMRVMGAFRFWVCIGSKGYNTLILRTLLLSSDRRYIRPFM